MSQQFIATYYNTLVFDCDGVVLNSNKVKTEAFYKVALPYGEAAAQAMVDYHVAHGGVSRYKKFAYFLEHIVPAFSTEHAGPNLNQLLQSYSCLVQQGLLNCDIAPDLELLRQQTPQTRWLIVSGGDQAELHEVFAKRDIAKWFDGGIFGSPDTKDEILSRELACGNIQHPALFLGDSKYDYQAANTGGLDFVFVSGWSEVACWEEWINQKEIKSVASIFELV